MVDNARCAPETYDLNVEVVGVGSSYPTLSKSKCESVCVVSVNQCQNITVNSTAILVSYFFFFFGSTSLSFQVF